MYSFEYNPEPHAQLLRDLATLYSNAAGASQSQLAHRFACGEINTAQFLQGYAATPNNDDQLPTIEEFERAWLSLTLPPSSAMMEIVKVVRSAGVRAALASDVYPFEARLARLWGRYNGFDRVFLSCELGMTKRQSQFFALVLASFSAAPARTLFIDDKENCIKSAASVGITTLLAEKGIFRHAADLAAGAAQIVLS